MSEATFFCPGCLQHKPIAGRGNSTPRGRAKCKSCDEKIYRNMNPDTARVGHNTVSSRRRATQKNVKKNYLSGKLPPFCGR